MNSIDQPTNHQTNVRSSEQTNRRETLSTSSPTDRPIQSTTTTKSSETFSGQTMSDFILINIRNFVFCFLTAWALTFGLAVFNDLSGEQFSACALRYRLVAVWFKKLITTTNYDPTVGGDRRIDDEVVNDEISESLLARLNHVRHVPVFRYTILIIQLIVIFSATLITVLNLISTFLKNRSYRIVPQCYVIEGKLECSTRFNKCDVANKHCTNKRETTLNGNGKYS